MRFNAEEVREKLFGVRGDREYARLQSIAKQLTFPQWVKLYYALSYSFHGRQPNVLPLRAIGSPASKAFTLSQENILTMPIKDRDIFTAMRQTRGVVSTPTQTLVLNRATTFFGQDFQRWLTALATIQDETSNCSAVQYCLSQAIETAVKADDFNRIAPFAMHSKKHLSTFLERFTAYTAALEKSTGTKA